MLLLPLLFDSISSFMFSKDCKEVFCNYIVPTECQQPETLVLGAKHEFQLFSTIGETFQYGHFRVHSGLGLYRPPRVLSFA